MPGALPIRDDKWLPTGKHRFRSNWQSKLILQIQVSERTGHTEGPNCVWTGHNTMWRDATVCDLESWQIVHLV